MPGAKPPDPGANDCIDMMIQVAEGYDVTQVAERLRDFGVDVARQLVRARIVSGKVPLGLADSLKDVPGVKLARVTESFRMPPFDDKVPQ